MIASLREIMASASICSAPAISHAEVGKDSIAPKVSSVALPLKKWSQVARRLNLLSRVATSGGKSSFPARAPILASIARSPLRGGYSVLPASSK
jgi:hypothetical protein